MPVHGLKILDSAARGAVVRSLGLRGAIAARGYGPYIHPPSPKPSSSLQQPSKAQPVWQRSFTTTTQTSTDKLRNAFRKARHDHPFLFPTLFIASFASVCWLALLYYDEYTREKPKFEAYPPGVERHLRNAIYYTEIKLDPTIAADHFTKAIDLAEREGMDPFSREVTGIHIRFAGALEKFGQAKGAVEVLSRLVNDMVERIEDIDLGRVTDRGSKAIKVSGSVNEKLNALLSAGNPSDGQESDRSRLLKLVIQCKVKISHLYGSDHIQDHASATRVLDEALETLLQTMPDPKSLQFGQNGAGISADEAAAMLSSAGTNYAEWGNFGTALGIFKLALVAVRQASQGTTSCREAYVLSCMAATTKLLLDEPNPIIDGKPATEASIKQARLILARWAHQSLQCVHAVEVTKMDPLCIKALLSIWAHIAHGWKDAGELKKARELWERVIQKNDSDPELSPMVSAARLIVREIEGKEQEKRR
jgi:tetratricopeptide (TPR) repeat protein